jgi:hypothetical protein
VRIVGLLSWYNENPAWLGAAVTSLAPFASHVVALDGAYVLYPGHQPRSPGGQSTAIAEAARAAGMGCTIHEPATCWTGNEVEKRDAMFRLAETVSEPDDWYFVLDGDEVVTSAPADLAVRCEKTALDVAEVTHWQYRKHYEPHERPFVTDFKEQRHMRLMFRAIRGLRVIGRHYDRSTPDGRNLWGEGASEPAEDFSDVRVEHRKDSRDLYRNNDAKIYYKRRDELNVEGLMPSEQ